MGKYIRCLFCCFICIFLYFDSIINVNAERFLIDTSTDCSRTSGCTVIPGNDTNPKYTVDGNVAYCSDHDLLFYGKDYKTGNYANGDGSKNIIEYSVDSNFSNAKNCRYNSSSNGDCSEIVGYIIAWSRQYYTNTKKYNDKAVWYWTQVTVWAYLAKFTQWGGTNTKAISFYDNYVDIRNVIANAWNEYSADKGVTTTNSDDVDFDLSYSDSNFYYVPSTSACNSGYYKTKNITVTNQEDVPINVNISADNTDIYLCVVGDSNSCAKSIEKKLVNKGSSVTFYLKYGSDVVATIPLKVVASYQSNLNKLIKYDSIRWIAPSNVPKPQGMLTFLTSNGTSGKVIVDHLSVKNANFSKTRISRTNCITSGNSDKNNTSSTPINKICASHDDVQNSKDYTAEFSGCTCFGIDLGNDRYVNVVLNENVVFKYGNLVPNDVLYAGGGFGFDDENGIPTQYGAKIKWAYADAKNGVPYYYNGNNLSDYDARKVEDLIVQKLKERIEKKAKNIKIDFSTYDSNDYKNNALILFSLNVPLSEYSYDNSSKTYSFNSNFMKLKQAYFSNDGKVKYGISDENYTIDGGSKYYVSMGYNKESFPFDITTVDLSIVDGINFWYKAECDKKVKEKYQSLYYRSIDVSNPFPKAKNISTNIPDNWREWYCGTGTTCNGNINNQKRIKNSYQNYPDSPLYRATLDLRKIDIITSIDSNYTSWSKMNEDGSNDFVIKMDLFEKVPNNESYCGIGQFNAVCDKVK